MLKFLEETSPRDRQPGKLDSELDQFFAMDMDSPSDVEHCDKFALEEEEATEKHKERQGKGQKNEKEQKENDTKTKKANKVSSLNSLLTLQSSVS